MFHNVVRRSLKAGSQYMLGRASCNLPASRCDRKCIQNDLDARRVRWNRTDFYSSVRARCNACPNQFVCTSGRNARPCVYCEPALKRSTLGGRSCNHFMFSSGIRGLWSLSTSNYLPRIRLANVSHAQVEASASFAICTYLFSVLLSDVEAYATGFHPSADLWSKTAPSLWDEASAEIFVSAIGS